MKESVRFIKFCCVGVGNFLVDFVVYLGGSQIMPIYPARCLAWGTACLFSYLVNRRWTFHAKDQGLMPLIRFAVVNAASLGLGLLLLRLFTGLGAGHILAYLLSLPFTIMTNFLGYRFWSFRAIYH